MLLLLLLQLLLLLCSGEIGLNLFVGFLLLLLVLLLLLLLHDVLLLHEVLLLLVPVHHFRRPSLFLTALEGSAVQDGRRMGQRERQG